MTYDEVFKPYWMKNKLDDPFDYKLRSKEEVFYQLYICPPIFPVYTKFTQRIYNKEIHNQSLTKEEVDNNIENKIKVYIKIDDLRLFPLQLQRLVFLLGPRFTGKNFIKLVSDQKTSKEENIALIKQQFKELYLEALRAPFFVENWMTNEEIKERDDFYGGKENSKELFDYLNDKTTETYQEFLEFYKIVNDPNVNKAEKDKLWMEVIKDAFYLSKEEEQQANSAITGENTLNQDIDVQTEKKEVPKLSKRQQALQKIKNRKDEFDILLKEGVLTKEAFSMYFNEGSKVNHI